MQTVQYKGHEGLGQQSSVLPWWGSAFGSEQALGGSCSHSKPFTIEVSNSGNQVTATKTKRGSTDDHEQGGLDKGITNQFTIIPDVGGEVTKETIDTLSKKSEENLILSKRKMEDECLDTNEDVRNLLTKEEETRKKLRNLKLKPSSGHQKTKKKKETEENKEWPPCSVCLKDKAHCSGNCPYRFSIPNPREVKLSEDYMILCKCCGEQLKEDHDPHPNIKELWVFYLLFPEVVED